jgi:hypothetical protein
VYPLNWAFWDGKMSEELYHEEHPLDALREMQEHPAAVSVPGDGAGAADRHQREVEAKWKGNS